MRASVDDTLPEQRILEKSMVLPSGGAVTGWAALRLLRGNFFDGVMADRVTQRPVPLIVPPDQTRRQRRGIVFAQDRLDEAEVQTRYGIRCTTVHRALFDEMRKSPGVREAVVALDMAAAASMTSIARMRRYVATNLTAAEPHSSPKHLMVDPHGAVGPESERVTTQPYSGCPVDFESWRQWAPVLR